MDFDVLVHTNVLEVGGYADEPPLEKRAAAQAHLFRQLYDPDRQRAVINIDGASRAHLHSLSSLRIVRSVAGYCTIYDGCWFCWWTHCLRLVVSVHSCRSRYRTHSAMALLSKTPCHGPAHGNPRSLIMRTRVATGDRAPARRLLCRADARGGVGGAGGHLLAIQP